MNKLQFNYASGTAAGSAITLLNAGFIDTSGILQWARSIKTSDVTVSSSTITGAIVSAGGIGIAGTAYIGGAGFVKSSQPICSGKYVQRSLGALVEISNLEVSWFTGLTSSGSLVYAAGSIVGLTLRFTGYMYLTVAGGGNYTLRLKNSSGTFITHTIAPVCTNKYTKIETLTTFASGTTCYTTSTILIDGLTPFIFYSSGTWNSAISQTLNVTQQFSISSAANFHKTHSCIFESIYEP